MLYKMKQNHQTQQIYKIFIDFEINNWLNWIRLEIKSYSRSNVLKHFLILIPFSQLFISK